MTINRTCDHCGKHDGQEIIKEGGELSENVQVGDFILRFHKDEEVIVQLCNDCRNSLVKYIKRYININISMFKDDYEKIYFDRRRFD